MADERLLEQEAGEDRAEREHAERDQHGQRALVRRVVAVRAMARGSRVRGGLDVVAVIVMRDALVVARACASCAMRQRPARAALEGHEKSRQE